MFILFELIHHIKIDTVNIFHFVEPFEYIQFVYIAFHLHVFDITFVHKLVLNILYVYSKKHLRVIYKNLELVHIEHMQILYMLIYIKFTLIIQNNIPYPFYLFRLLERPWARSFQPLTSSNRSNNDIVILSSLCTDGAGDVYIFNSSYPVYSIILRSYLSFRKMRSKLNVKWTTRACKKKRFTKIENRK